MRLQELNRNLFPGAACVLVALFGFPCSDQAIADLPACEAKSPTIDGTTIKEVSMAGVSLEAQINPQGNETSYSFTIVWRAVKPLERGEAMPAGSPSQEGHIAAGSSDVTVTAILTGLSPGYTYWYEVVAASLGNNTRSVGPAVSYFNPSWYFSGYEEGPPYKPSERAGCFKESGQLAADRIVREQHELEAREAEEAAALRRQTISRPSAQTCRVPNLKGKTLTAARRAIDRAHCRLGRVTRSPHSTGKLVVARQSPHPGASLREGALVKIALGSTHTRRNR